MGSDGLTDSPRASSEATGGDPAAPGIAAVCGLFCSACTFYIGTHEDPARLERLAAAFGMSADRLLCDGCWSERRLFYCDDCRLFACAQQKGFTSCGECPDSPCPDLQAFVAERPHRADIYADLARIAEIGKEAWVVEATARYSCPDCGALNSAYDLKCRKCGRDPSNAYVEVHREEIVARIMADRNRA